MTQLIVHIGAGKTGSTAIQQYLAYNQRVLSHHGVSYPLMPGWDVTQPGVAHNPLAYALLDPSANAVNIEATRRALNNAFERADTVVLSAEVLYMRPREADFASFHEYELRKRNALEELARWFKGVDTRVVCYVRRQDLWLESIYAERVKTWKTRGESLNSFLQNVQEEHFSWQLDLWASIVGDENVVVRPYEAGQLCRSDVVEDFANVVGINQIDEMKVPSRSAAGANPRLLRDVLEYQIILDRIPWKAWEKRELGRALREISESVRTREGDDPAYWQRLIGEDVRRDILERFAAANAEVARRYLGRSDGRLFREDCATQESQQEYPGLSVERALAIHAEIERIRSRLPWKIERWVEQSRELVRSRAPALRPLLSPLGKTWQWVRKRHEKLR